MFLLKRKSNRGRPPSIGTIGVENKFTWPQTIEFIPLEVKKLLMGLSMELAVNFLFKNFCYTWGKKMRTTYWRAYWSKNNHGCGTYSYAIMEG